MTYNTAINITEEERQRISELHDLTILSESLTKKISEFRFTPDRKYVIFEEQLYSTETGELHPLLLEKWSLSDILHTVGDVASMAADFIIPGSGAIVDAINGVSYFIEGLITKDKGKRKSLFIMGAITMAFVIIPGPLQAVAIPMKRFVKYGAKKAASKTVLAGLEIVYKNLGKILQAIPRTIQKVADSPLGMKVFGKKLAPRMSKKMGDVVRNIKSSFDDLMSNARKAAPEGPKDASFRKTQADKIYDKKVGRKKGGVGRKTARRAGKILRRVGINKLDNILKVGVPEGPLTRKVLRHLGFGKGGTYKYVVPKSNRVVKIRVINTTADGVICRNLTDGAKFSVNNSNFVFNAVAAPWVRRGKGRWVPFFVKRLTDVMTSDGQFDEQALMELPSLSPDQTSIESLAYLHEDLGSPEGKQTKKEVRTTSNDVSAFQTALMALGYSLPKYGADGNLGSETQRALNQFQIDASLTGSHGRMDRLTAQKLSLELKARSIPNSEKLQKTLNNI